MPNDQTLTLAWCELREPAPDPRARVIAPGDPPLTREVTDALVEAIGFMAGEASGRPFAANQEMKDGVAAVAAAAYPRLSAKQRQGLAQMPLQWASLQALWPVLPEAERDKLRAEWREMLKATTARTDEQIRAEESLQALQALIRTGQQRPLLPAELGAAAAHMDTVAVALRQQGGEQNLAMAAQLAETAQTFRAAARQGSPVSTSRADTQAGPSGAVRMIQQMNQSHFITMNMINFMSRRF
jgi:hypothetical protein